MNKIADPTFAELRLIKVEIQSFVLDIFNPSAENRRNQLINICKKVVLAKYLIRQEPSDSRYRALLSDLCYLLNSIESGETRYYYFNVRSVIEQSLRIIADVEDTSTITNVELMEKADLIKGSISQAHLINTDIIKDEYSKSCLYIHGNSQADMNLVSYYINAFHQSKQIDNLDTKLNQLIALLNSLFALLLICKSEMVDGAFHRRKSILRYLINDNELVDYIISHENQGVLINSN
jgi:hypothetical protein